MHLTFLSIFLRNPPHPVTSPGRLPGRPKSRGEAWAQWLVLGSLLVFCITVALTLEVNPFPEDNWFITQFKLFVQAHGHDNYTPISAPAYYYFSIHMLAKLLGFDMQAEFYLASLIQNLTVFAAGLCLYRAHVLLGLRTLGLLVTAAFVVFVASTLITQAFWSETIVLFLMSVLVLCVTRIASCIDADRRTLSGWSLLLGLTLGLLVSTRMVPIVLLPGLALLFHYQLGKQKARLSSAIVLVCVFVLVAGSMTANKWRFDRFELSNSMGRHLWQNIRHQADAMLAQSEEFQKLKSVYPDIASKNWWEVPVPATGFEHLSREELLRTLSIQAITARPVFYLQFGILNTPRLLWERPGQWGKWEGSIYNPLKRSSKLPPLLGPLPGLEVFLAKVNSRSASIWPFATFGILLIWAIAALRRLTGRLRNRPADVGAASDHGNPLRGRGRTLIRVGDFLVFALIAQLWVTGQIEPALSRYLLPYLSVLALLGSIMLHRLAEMKRGK